MLAEKRINLLVATAAKFNCQYTLARASTISLVKFSIEYNSTSRGQKSKISKQILVEKVSKFICMALKYGNWEC